MKTFPIRQQLTLFISDQNELIEKVRAEFNPIQFDLISAHVTLCREDEISAVEKIVENIKSVFLDKPIRIDFDLVKRFDNGKGVLIPAKVMNNEYYDLRKSVLKGIYNFPRNHQPHITLMHPRNSTCTDLIFDKINKYKFPSELYFDTISLIEQKNGGRWKLLNNFLLK